MRPVPGVLDVIRLLDVPFCVASNGRPEKVTLTLRTSGLAQYFEHRIFTFADVARGKPAPDVFLLAAERCAAEPRRCVVVKDSPSGVAAARAAGMRVLGFVPGRDQTLDGAERALHGHGEASGTAHLAANDLMVRRCSARPTRTLIILGRIVMSGHGFYGA